MTDRKDGAPGEPGGRRTTAPEQMMERMVKTGCRCGEMMPRMGEMCGVAPTPESGHTAMRVREDPWTA